MKKSKLSCDIRSRSKSRQERSCFATGQNKQQVSDSGLQDTVEWVKSLLNTSVYLIVVNLIVKENIYSVNSLNFLYWTFMKDLIT